MAQQGRRMKMAAPDVEPEPERTALAAPTAPGWAIESVFSAGRPSSPRRGLEPAFVLFESHVMEALRRRAAERGFGYDALVRMIVRDHIDKY